MVSHGVLRQTSVTHYNIGKNIREVIEKNGGKLEKSFYDDITKKYIQRFWINTMNDKRDGK